MDDDGQDTSSSKPTERRLLERCRDIAVGSLCGALQGVLERLDEEFFQLAEKAVVRDTQRLYLDAMAMVRDQRGRIAQGFRNHLLRGFNAAMQGGPERRVEARFEETMELALVDADALEESIAIQEMSAKMQANCREELFALDKRMGVLLRDEELTSHKNPLGVEVLANAFIAACAETDAALKVRLLFVTGWDRYMQNGVSAMYHEVNQYLVENGILPKIKRDYKRQGMGMKQVEQIAGVAAQAAVQALAMTEEDGDVFETMRHLMHAAVQRGASAGFGGMVGVPGGGVPGMGGNLGVGGAPSVMGVPGAAAVFGAAGAVGLAGQAPPLGVGVAHNPLVLTQLTQLQQGDTAFLGAASSIDVGTLASGNANVLHALKSTDLANNLGAMDAMTIDIVAMLFDFIFDDRRLPDTVKALLGRLQIPVLKAAMLDQAFFSKKTHPTRRLLNAMAEAASAWGEPIESGSSLYQKIEQIVQHINEAFEDNLDVFENALAEFERFLAERETAADALVEVSIGMIEAREREQIKEEDAQRMAEDAVRARAADPEIPEAVRVFLCQEWIKPLRSACMTGGQEGHAWLAAAGLMDDLIWSVRPKLTRESRQYMVKTLPALLRRLQEGMQQAGIETAVRERFMSQLVQCHAGAVKAGFQAPVPVEAQPAPEEAWKAAVRARQANGAEQESAVVLPFARPVRAREERDVKLEIIKSEPAHGQLEVEEITIASVGWADDAAGMDAEGQELPPEMVVLDEASAKRLIADLKPGVWVEFRHEGEETLQAKLKWISPLKSAYLFTDRQGKRAATMPQEKLEAAFRVGSARLIEQQPLLDRAVDNVLETLKRAVA